MRRRQLTLLLTMLVCIGVIVPLGLFFSIEQRETTGVSESSVEVVAYETAQAPITVGVILTGSAADFGWYDVPADGADFVATTLNGNTVIVLDRLNATYRPGLTLKWALEGVLDRGATVVFVSSAYLSEAGEIRVSEQYPNIVFIMNLSTRANVERLLSALPDTVSDMHPGALGTDWSATATETSESSDTEAKGPAIVLTSITILMVTLIVSLLLAARLGNRSRGGAAVPVKTGAKRKRRSAGSGAHARELALEAEARSRMTDFAALGQKPPVIHELSTYVMGDQYFDESFPIELASGEFLGECGLSISEPVSRYDKDRVAAFELWLFDKRAISTTTTVLASQHAATSLTMREKLAQKGTLHQADVAAPITLETDSLRLQARILTMSYGFADTFPINSFFDHIVVEIAVLER